MLVFAYGSYLNPGIMRERCPSHRAVGLAAAHDQRLGFPRWSDEWQGGEASLVPAHGRTVWGMVYELDDRDLAALDLHAGYRGPRDQHNVHDREVVTVELTRPDDGSVPRRVRTVAYLARPSNPSPPSRRYLDAVIAGARHHRLPEEYVEELDAIVTAELPPSG